MQIGDRVHDNTKKPHPRYDLVKPDVLLNPEGWILGTIVSVAEAEICSACKQVTVSPVIRWNIDWDDGRNTVQDADSLVVA